MKKVSIVIPNWDGKDYLKDCLDSLCEISYHDYMVVVVDNGSSDGSVELLKSKYTDVVIIENKENLGFSAACNKGIEYSIKNGFDYVLLLNNDTIVEKDFLSKMVSTGEDDKVGIVGSKILYNDNRDLIWYAGGDYISWRVSGKHRHWMKKDSKSLSGVKDCTLVTGCNMLIKKEVFDDIGLFYNPYFLTVEDLDFCYNAAKSGWKLRVNLDARIYHKVSLSRGGEFSFSNGYYGVRNRLIFAFKRGGGYLGGFIFLFLVVPIRFLQWVISGERDMVKGMALGLKDFIRGKQGKVE
jgi:GT2 family glycosyltransferase